MVISPMNTMLTRTLRKLDGFKVRHRISLYIAALFTSERRDEILYFWRTAVAKLFLFARTWSETYCQLRMNQPETWFYFLSPGKKYKINSIFSIEDDPHQETNAIFFYSRKALTSET